MSALSLAGRGSLRALLWSVLILTALVMLLRAWQVVDAVRWIERVDTQQRTVGRMAATSVRLLVTAQSHLLQASPRITQQWAFDWRALRDDVALLRGMEAIDAEAVSEFEASLQEVDVLFRRVGEAPARDPALAMPSERLVQALHRLSDQAYRYEGHIGELRSSERSRLARSAVAFNIALVVLMLLLVGLLARRVLRPLGQLAAVAAHVQRTGALDRRVGYRARDEMGAALQGFDAMLDHLAHAREELASALERQTQARWELASTIEGTNVGTWAWNVQTGETRFNERWAQMIGWDLAELQPVNIDTWVRHAHPDDLQRSGDLLQAHFRGDAPFYECEARMRHRLGHWVWVLDRGRVFTRTADGQPEWMYGTHQDISERKALEQRLADARGAAESASRAKSRFVATVSHELRTPLHALLGMHRLLARDLTGARELDLLHRADQAGQALLATVNDVLDLARIEAGEMALNPQAWQPRALAEELVAVYGLQAQAKGLELHSDLDDTLPEWLLGDAHRVRQVLTNLLGNALRFSEHGAVVLRWRRHGSGAQAALRVSVIDSGVGIEEQRLKDMFAPFVQADADTDRRHGGSGLGLAIVEQLVSLMGGTVGARSKPGEGSSFWVDLPLIEPEPAARPPGGPAPAVDGAVAGPTRWLVGLRGLVCDDDEVNRQIVRDLLETQGAHGVVCADGQQALDWLREHPGTIDLVFMDVHMPGLDGLHAARRLRDDPATADLPVIALSAGSLASEREAALAAGMNAFLSKPFDVLQLVQVVREHLPPALAARLGVDHGGPADAGPTWPRPADGDGPAMGELLDLLLRRDLDAVDWVLAREAALVEHLGAARARVLREAVESLDYAGALRCLGEAPA